MKDTKQEESKNECNSELAEAVVMPPSDSAVFVRTGEGEYEQLTVWMSEKEALECKNKKDYFPTLTSKIVLKEIEA